MPNLGKCLVCCACFWFAAEALGQQIDLPPSPNAMRPFWLQRPVNDYRLPPLREVAVLSAEQVNLDSVHEYTLPELVEIAERQDPRTRGLTQVARNAEVAVKIVKSTYYPTLTGSAVGGYQRTDPNGGSVSSGSTSVNTNSNSSSLKGAVATVSLAWLLFDFGGRAHLIDETQKLARAAAIAVTGQQQALIQQVSTAYYAYNAARLRHDANLASLTETQSIEKAARDRYGDGIGTVLETTQAHQATALAELNVVQAQGSEQDTYATLLTTMGISPLDTIRIAPLKTQYITDDMMQPLNRLVADSLARRPDVQAAFAAEQASESAVKVAKSQYFPKIVLSGTGAYVSNTLSLSALPGFGDQSPTLNITNSQFNGTIVAGLTVPIFDGGRRAAAVEQAKNNVVSATATLDGVRMNAMRQIIGAQNTLKTSVAANRASAALQDAAQTAYDAAFDAYNHGVGTVTALLAAEIQLHQARIAVEESQATMFTSAVALIFASGELGNSPE